MQRQRWKKEWGGGPNIPWRPLILKKSPATAYTSLLFLLILLTAAFVSSLWPTLSATSSKPTTITNTVANQTIVSTKHGNSSRETIQEKQHALNCSEDQTCANNYPKTTTLEMEEKEVRECPEYFRWIHEDLKAWKGKGISREMVETAKKTAHFRLVVKKGKAYVEKYKKSIQTRDVFTMWGILQLLRRYPGKVPDLELMFDCDDKPVIQTRHYGGSKFNSTGPPPLFRYCGDRWTEDIVFPDWSFWGWYVP